MRPTRLPGRMLIAAGLALGIPVWSGAADAQPFTRPQLQELFASHLRSESLAPTVDSNGNVRFRRQGRTYVIEIDENDPLYFRLRLSFVAQDTSDTGRVRYLEGCNAASSQIKVVKCFLDEEGDPTFAAEMFVIVPGDFKASLDRVLRAIDGAHERFTRTVNELR